MRKKKLLKEKKLTMILELKQIGHPADSKRKAAEGGRGGGKEKRRVAGGRRSPVGFCGPKGLRAFYAPSGKKPSSNEARDAGAIDEVDADGGP